MMDEIILRKELVDHQMLVVELPWLENPELITIKEKVEELVETIGKLVLQTKR